MPFSKMPKSVKSGVKNISGSKGAKKQWMAAYESAKKQGFSKDRAAAIAYAAIKKTAKKKTKNEGFDGSLSLSMFLLEADVLEYNSELKSLIEKMPKMCETIQAHLKEDKYTTLVKDLQDLCDAASKAKKLLEQTLEKNKGEIKNIED